jgi:hypothetical protein
LTTTWSRWIRTALLRLIDAGKQLRWILLSTALVVTSLLGLFVHIPLWVNLALWALSAVLLRLEIRKHREVQRATHFPVRERETFSDVQKALAGNERYQVKSFPVGTFLLDLATSQAVQEGRVLARPASTNYISPPEVKEFGENFRRRQVNAGTYNGSVLGLRARLGSGSDLASKDWEMVPARYWDHLATDIFAMSDVDVAGHERLDLGRPLFIDRHGMPRDPADSWLLNAVGTSAMALTTDRRVVLVAQSAKNQSSKDLMAPSGSGSLELGDFQGESSLPFDMLARNGALRELCEETGLSKQDVQSTAFLGFGRWLDKAAKPEAFTLVILNVDSHEVLRRGIPAADRPFSLLVKSPKIDMSLDQLQHAQPQDVLGEEWSRKLSLPTLMGLSLMSTSLLNDWGAAELLKGLWGEG